MPYPASRSRPALLLLGPALAVLATLASLAPAPAQAFVFNIQSGAQERVVGSGRVTEVKRAIGPFSRLRLDSAITVLARPAATPGLTVKADDNLVPLIQTQVEGDTLVVRIKPNTSLRTNTPMVVTVDFTSLRHADLRGSGDLNISALKGDEFELSLAGSGDVRIDNAELGRLGARLAGSGDMVFKGRSDEASYTLAGSGDVNALELQARRVSVDIAGSGDVKVHASESLAVQIAGSGGVAYAGNPPKVTRRVNGSGELRALDAPVNSAR